MKPASLVGTSPRIQELQASVLLTDQMKVKQISSTRRLRRQFVVEWVLRRSSEPLCISLVIACLLHGLSRASSTCLLYFLWLWVSFRAWTREFSSFVAGPSQLGTPTTLGRASKQASKSGAASFLNEGVLRGAKNNLLNCFFALFRILSWFLFSWVYLWKK